MFILVIYPGCVWNAAGSFTFWAGLEPLVPFTTWGSWWGEGGDSEVGSNGYAKRSSPKAAAAGDREG